jgi:exopolysaccharide production protein ExoQ
MLGSSAIDGGAALKLTNIRWVLIFLGFSACSLFWTESISPTVSAAYWFGTASDVAMMVLLLRGSLSSVAADSLMEGFVWGAFVIAIAAWIMPAQYDLRLGDEDYFNANTIGNICAFGAFFAQYASRSGKKSWHLITIFLAVTLIRSLSKTAIAAFVISEVFLIIQDGTMSPRVKGYLTLGATVVVLMFWGLFEAYYDFYTTYGNQSETLTGRTAIWAYVVDAALLKPWFGYGFDSMWKVVPVFGTFEARHAENEILEQLYSYGVAGVVILCGLYGDLYRKLRKWQEAPLRVVCVAMLIFVLIRGIAEAEPFDVTFRLWTIVLLTFLATRAKTMEESQVRLTQSMTGNLESVRLAP